MVVGVGVVAVVGKNKTPEFFFVAVLYVGKNWVFWWECLSHTFPSQAYFWSPRFFLVRVRFRFCPLKVNEKSTVTPIGLFFAGCGIFGSCAQNPLWMSLYVKKQRLIVVLQQQHQTNKPTNNNTQLRCTICGSQLQQQHQQHRHHHHRQRDQQQTATQQQQQQQQWSTEQQEGDLEH